MCVLMLRYFDHRANPMTIIGGEGNTGISILSLTFTFAPTEATTFSPRLIANRIIGV